MNEHRSLVDCSNGLSCRLELHTCCCWAWASMRLTPTFVLLHPSPPHHPTTGHFGFDLAVQSLTISFPPTLLAAPSWARQTGSTAGRSFLIRRRSAHRSCLQHCPAALVELSSISSIPSSALDIESPSPTPGECRLPAAQHICCILVVSLSSRGGDHSRWAATPGLPSIARRPPDHQNNPHYEWLFLQWRLRGPHAGSGR